METTGLLEQLRQYREDICYDCSDIAEKLISLAELEDDDRLREEILESLYHLRNVACNPYNRDHFRVLYNVLLIIAGIKN